MEETKKEVMWKKLKEVKKGKQINMVQFAKDVGCSLAYLSTTLRHSFESGYLEFDTGGSYVIKDIPPYEEFRDSINKKYNKYRRSIKSSSTGQRIRTSSVPKDFKVDENTIVAVIAKLIKDKKEVEEKLEKVIAYTKKIKVERDQLLSGISEIDL